MIISYLGGDFVKVQFADMVIAVNPPSKDSRLAGARFGADVALVSVNQSDMNGVETVFHGDRRPFVISGPGAYEIKGVVIKGFPTELSGGGEKHINTVYTVALEGMTLCFLGALSGVQLPPALKEELDDIDVLFLPIGGEGVLSAVEAYKLSVAMEPRLIIPVHFSGVGEKDALKHFLKEAGEEKSAAQEKLTLKKKDLEGKEGEIVVLRAN